jgi:hypothetical protein
MADKEIYLALSTALEPVGIPINWPNQSDWAMPTTPWIRFNQPIIGDNQVTLGSGGYNENQGFLQVDVFTPKLSGILTSYDIAASVKALIGSGAELTHGGQCVRIKSAAVSPGNADDAWNHMLISVEFTSYTTRSF